MAEPATYLSGARLQALLPPEAALQALQRFFAANGRDAVAAPTRIHMPVPGQSTLGLYMPAATRQFVGLKSVHLMPERFPSVEAEVFLYDAETGRLLFWGDGKPLTALRTAGVSAAASLAILPSCRSLVLFGAGVQAAAHAEAFVSAYPELETVHAVTRSLASYERLQAAVSDAVRSRLRSCTQPESILPEVDCVIATTPAGSPLFDWARLSERCHVVGIGSATPAMNELPPQAFVEGRVWLDTRAAIEEAGDLHAALAAGWKPELVAGDLFDLLGPEAAIERGQGRTVFKSVGQAAQDLAILIYLWERIQADGA